MARKARPTRAEIRARNACIPAARVWALIISDPRADVWLSNLAMYADDPHDADEQWRRIGVVRGYWKLRHDETDDEYFAIVKERPGTVSLRRDTQPDGEPWMALPDDYHWPHETVALYSFKGLLSEELGRRPQVLRDQLALVGVENRRPLVTDPGRAGGTHLHLDHLTWHGWLLDVVEADPLRRPGLAQPAPQGARSRPGCGAVRGADGDVPDVSNGQPLAQQLLAHFVEAGPQLGDDVEVTIR